MNENVCKICNRKFSEHSSKELRECAIAEQERDIKKIKKHYEDMSKDEIF